MLKMRVHCQPDDLVLSLRNPSGRGLYRSESRGRFQIAGVAADRMAVLRYSPGSGQ